MSKNVAKKTFYIFDLDRTLFDTVKGSDRLVALIQERDEAAAEEAVRQIGELTSTGASFSIRDLLVEIIGEPITEEIYKIFLDSTDSQELLLPGAREVIEFADDHSDGWGILTFGSERGQHLKLVAAGLEKKPYIVTQMSDKGALLRSWLNQSTGMFELPDALGGHHIDDLVFVDDRLFSFDGIPAEVTGYWVSPGLSVLDSIEHPRSVRPIHSIKDMIKFERQRRSIDKA